MRYNEIIDTRVKDYFMMEPGLQIIAQSETIMLAARSFSTLATRTCTTTIGAPPSLDVPHDGPERELVCKLLRNMMTSAKGVHESSLILLWHSSLIDGLSLFIDNARLPALAPLARRLRTVP